MAGPLIWGRVTGLSDQNIISRRTVVLSSWETFGEEIPKLLSEAGFADPKQCSDCLRTSGFPHSQVLFRSRWRGVTASELLAVLRISDIGGPIEAWRMSGIHIWDSSGNVHARWTFESLDLVCAGRQVTA